MEIDHMNETRKSNKNVKQQDVLERDSDNELKPKVKKPSSKKMSEKVPSSQSGWALNNPESSMTLEAA